MAVLRFAELPAFTARVQASIGDAALRSLQNELIEQPEKGALLQGTGELRKVRVPMPGTGKSGGARVIYLYLPELPCIVFFYLFTKGTADNISAAGKAVLRAGGVKLTVASLGFPGCNW